LRNKQNYTVHSIDYLASAWKATAHASG